MTRRSSEVRALELNKLSWLTTTHCLRMTFSISWSIVSTGEVQDEFTSSHKIDDVARACGWIFGPARFPRLLLPVCNLARPRVEGATKRDCRERCAKKDRL